MQMTELAWIKIARGYIGLREIPGVQNEGKIVAMWKWIKRGGIKSDSVPWCSAFVGACLEQAGIVSSRFESAKSYLTWGLPIKFPMYGCVVVFSRNGGGHVGFLVGKDFAGRLMILGGNQGDKVSIAPFPAFRVVGYRWPIDTKINYIDLPVISSNAPLSSNED